MLCASIGHSSQKLWQFEYLKAFFFNFERVDILWFAIEHPSQKLLSFEFVRSFHLHDGEIEGDVNHRIQAGWMK